jgi:hypothetical protein
MHRSLSSMMRDLSRRPRIVFLREIEAREER